MAMSAESLSDFLNSLHRELASDPLDKEQEELAAIVRDSVIENFSNQRDYDGNGWEERKGDYFHDPLMDTLAMYGAATVKGATGAIENRDRSEIIMGVSVDDIEYAAAQNYGYEEGNLPAREYMYIRKEHHERFDEPMIEGLTRVFDDHIERHQA